MGFSIRANTAIADRRASWAALEQRLARQSSSPHEFAAGLRSTLTDTTGSTSQTVIAPSDGFQRINSEIKDAAVASADDLNRPDMVPYMQNLLYGASAMSAYAGRGMRLDVLA